MAADGGGSFWTTFGGASDAPELSRFEKLLQTPGCSVEALLDEEEVIQEFKTGNTQLVARLCEPDAAKALMELITCEPLESATTFRKYRYPFVTVELVTCGPEPFFEALVSPDRPEALNYLWSFLERTPPNEVNPVLAGYFARTVATVFSKHPGEAVEHLRRRAGDSKGIDRLLTQFLERLHHRSIAELLARVVCVSQPSQMLFRPEDLVSRLLETLQDVGRVDAQENVTLVILELLSQKENLSFGEELMSLLTMRETITFLVNHMFSGLPGSVPSAASILSSVIFHTDLQMRGMTVCTTSPSMSPLAMPPAPVLGEDDMVNMGLDEPVVQEAVTAKAPMSPPRSPMASLTVRHQLAGNLQSRSAQLSREVCFHFPRFRQLLEASLKAEDALMELPQGPVRPVGSTVLEVVSLLATLVKTGSNIVLESVLQHQLVPLCFQIFLSHPWSSLLHNTLRPFFAEVLAFLDGGGIREELVMQFLKEGQVAKRIVAEFHAEALHKAEPSSSSGGKRRHARVGYMGQLHLICLDLRSLALQSPQVREVLQSEIGWADVVLPALEAMQAIYRDPLGGGVPSEDRNLTTSAHQSTTGESMGPSSLSSNLETDFVLEDVTDFEDDQLRTPNDAFGDNVFSFSQQKDSEEFDPDSCRSLEAELDEASPWSAPAPSLSFSVGAENLFALLGDFKTGPLAQAQPFPVDFPPVEQFPVSFPAVEAPNSPSQAFASVPPPLHASEDVWAAPPASLAGVEPFVADFGSLAGLPSGAASAGSSSDRSWVADFDPLFSCSGPAAAAVAVAPPPWPSRTAPTAPFTLDGLWPAKG